ncbi:MAG: hypothetical protein JXN63_02430 [Candidatus Delongbacteria bacterium]|nr:hypothetical protein [Candidatus Delongbacteria bacterium]
MSDKLPVKPVRNLSTFKELKSFSVYINLFSQTKIGGMTRSVFRIVVEDNISHHKFIGYSFDKSRNGIDIFVNYVLSNLEIRGGHDKNLRLLNGNEFLGSDIIEYKPVKKRGRNKVIKGIPSHREIIKSIYKEMIFNDGHAEFEGYSETDNPILPPLFVDSFLKDIDKIVKFTGFWRNYSMDKKDADIHNEALHETSGEVDRIRDEFEFEKALRLYSRIGKAAERISGSEKLSANLLLKRAKIFFHLEEYDKCRELIEENLKEFEALKLKDELGEFYYYLGMISSYANNFKEADSYFARSSRMLTDSKEPGKTNLYFRSRIRRFILKNDNNHALTLVNKAVRHSIRNNDQAEAGYLYGIKSEIYFLDRKFALAEETLNIQLEYACETKDPVAESKCLAQMFQLLAYREITDESRLLKDIRRIQSLAKEIRKTGYYYDSLMNLGVFCYRNDRLDDAERYFNRASRIYTENTTDAASHIINMIFLAKIRIGRKNFLSAIRLLNRMLKLCEKRGVNIYPAYINNLLGRIYFENKNHRKSVLFLNRALKLIVEGKIKDKILKANTLKYIGLNYISLNFSKKAIVNLNKALKLLELISNDPGSDVGHVISDIKSEINILKNKKPL